MIATFSEPKKYGIERGMPIFHRICSLRAPSERITSCSSGSMVASPVATLTTTGKNEIRKAVMIAGTVPMPNQITRIGTIATLGMALNATISG